MRIFWIALFLSVCGALSAQVPAPKPKTPLPVKPPAAGPVAQPFDKVVLTVGDEKMTIGEYEKFVDNLPEQFRATARGAGKRQVADQLASIKSLAQEARKRKLDQDPAFKAQMAFQAENLLAGTLFRNLSANLKVEEADARKYYDEHKSEYDRVKARHILVRFKGSSAPAGKTELTEAQALEKAKALRARIVAGEDFAAIAKAESDDTGSGANGGELDFFSHGQMVPPFDQAAFAAPIGQITEPVKSQFGYHLIEVQKRETKTFDEVRGDIEKKLRPELAKQAVENLRKQTPVTIDESFFGPPPPAPPAVK
jgi:peptidyl-prolyl cis-trans isomerase C